MLKIHVKSLHFHADAKLVAFIEKKLNRLERYVGPDAKVDVLLKLQDNGGKIQDKISEIHLYLSGETINYKKTDKTFEAAIDASFETLKRQVTRLKERKNSFSRMTLEVPEE